MTKRPIAAAIASLALLGSAAAYAQSGYGGTRNDGSSSYGKAYERDDRDRPKVRKPKDDHRAKKDEHRANKNDQRQEHLYARDYRYKEDKGQDYGQRYRRYERDSRRYDAPARYDRPARNYGDERSSYVRRDQYARPDTYVRPEKVEKVEKVERYERPEKAEKVEKYERPDRVAKVERVERPEKPERGGSGRH